MAATPDPPPAFGALLRRYRLAAALSQEALAERAGLSARAIRALETGERAAPYRETVALLAEALGLGAAERAALAGAVHRPHRPPGPVTPPPPIALPAALPTPLTSFIGRERELAEVRELLAAARLVTLTGPPGVGKTRLALALAATAGPAFADGAAFVPLASLADPALVVPAIAQALGVREAPRRPLAETLADALRPRRLLLVLDNFEQLPEAAPAVAALLERASGLVALVTSRAALRVRGEHAFALPPLALPPEGSADPSAVLTSEAVRLFLERTREAGPGVEPGPAQAALLAELCRRLDGLPLALELAATRTRLLSLPALLARLERRLPVLTGGARDLPARQRTLRAAIAWSDDLLDASQRALFRRLAVFVGGCSLAAAGTVGEPEAVPSGAPSDALTALVEHSLVHRLEGPGDEPRFAMLEAIREYARERLDARGEGPATEERHADYFLALAEAAAPSLHADAPAERARARARLAAEHDNLRAALGRLLDRGDAGRSVRLAIALTPYWFARQHLTEGRAWWDRLLASVGAALDPRSRAEALGGAAAFANGQGDAGAARALLGEALPLLRALGEPLPLARALLQLGAALGRTRDPAARPLVEEGLALARALGRQRLLADALSGLAFLSSFGGDQLTGRSVAAEALAVAKRAGYRAGEMGALHQLGNAAFLAGDLAAARTYFEQCRAVVRELGLRDEQTLIRLGEVAAGQGDSAAAAACFAQALAQAREVDELDSEAWALQSLGHLARQQGEEESAAASFRASLALRWRQGHTLGMLGMLDQVAASAARRGQAERSARLFAAAGARWADRPLLAADLDRAWIAPAVAAVRAALGQAAFGRAWAAGAALTLEEAVAEALGSDDGGGAAGRSTAGDGP